MSNVVKKFESKKQIQKAFDNVDNFARDASQAIGVLNMRLTSLINTVEVLIQLLMDEGIFNRGEFVEARTYYQQFLSLLNLIDKEIEDTDEVSKKDPTVIKFIDRSDEEIAEFIYQKMINSRMNSGVLARYSDRLSAIFKTVDQMENVISLLEEKILKYEADLRLKEDNSPTVELSAIGTIGSDSVKEVVGEDKE